MPVYEYVCKECGNHTEVSQSFKDDPLTTCQVCGGPLRKVFNSIGIVLKGSGFYRTDSRMPAKPEKADKKADKEKAGASAGGESKSGDSKGSGDGKSSTSDSKSKSSASSSSSSGSSESKSSKSA